MRVHLPGVGDFAMSEVSALDDPCAPPDRTTRRRLDSKDKRLYAPMSNLGSSLGVRQREAGGGRPLDSPVSGAA